MKRVFIFLHGAEKETFLRLKPKEEESIICADSGISLARKIKYSPKKVILIGDLDSVSKKDISWCKDNKINIKKYSPNKIPLLILISTFSDIALFLKVFDL